MYKTQEFSIELQSENIYDPKTRKYFHEVLSSYISQNYRSATVMLWSVVIVDLVYKLQHMKDIYNDQSAIDILTKIKKMQDKDPKNPAWELELLTMAKAQTNLLDAAEYQNIKDLQSQRHLSAHPVLGESDLLHSPNKETVRALIRNALEAVLLKPPLFTRKIFDLFVEDISSKKDVMIDEKKLYTYIDHTYLKNIHSSVRKEFVKSLWKLCFGLSDITTDANRQINLNVLVMLYENDNSIFQGIISDSRDYLRGLNINIDKGIKSLIIFLSRADKVYKLLSESITIMLDNHIEKNPCWFVPAIFMSENITEHLTRIGEMDACILDDTLAYHWQLLVEHCEKVDMLQNVFMLGVKIYMNSSSYDIADANFDIFIKPYFKKFDIATTDGFINDQENNSQVCARRAARHDHNKIKEHREVLNNIQ